MKNPKFLTTILSLAISAILLYANNDVRIVLDKNESQDISITELPGFGLVATLGGDSIMLIDDPQLPVVHIPAMADTRQLIVTDSAIFCSVENYICRFDSTYQDLVDVAVFDNHQFMLYPACGNSMFVVTADNDFSDCHLIDPDNGIYTDVLFYEGLIRKVSASCDHVFMWVDDNICLVGDNQALATLISDPAINDMVLTPSGLVIANSGGLYVIRSPQEIKKLSDNQFSKLWYVNSSLYLQHKNGSIIAIDDFSPEN